MGVVSVSGSEGKVPEGTGYSRGEAGRRGRRRKEKNAPEPVINNPSASLILSSLGSFPLTAS